MSRTGICLTSSRWKAGASAIDGCAIWALTASLTTSSELRHGWVRRMGRPDGVTGGMIMSNTDTGKPGWFPCISTSVLDDRPGGEVRLVRRQQRRFYFRVGGASPAQKLLDQRDENHPPTGPLEQRPAHPPLQRSDQPAHPGLRGAAEAGWE